MSATASTNSPKSKTPSPFKSAVPNKQHSTKARINLVSCERKKKGVNKIRDAAYHIENIYFSFDCERDKEEHSFQICVLESGNNFFLVGTSLFCCVTSNSRN